MFPGQISKSTINIERLVSQNTDYSPFETIIYILKDSDRLLIEKPNTDECFTIPTWKISKYIRLTDVKIDWFTISDGTKIKIADKKIHEITCIKKDFSFEWVNFNFAHTDNDNKYKAFREIETDTFSCKKKSKHFIISAFLPLWPLWAKLAKDRDSEIYSLQKMYMKIDDQFYRFPYGNVSSTNNVCTGAGNIGHFKNKENVYLSWMSSPFNLDYTINLRANKLDDKKKFIPTTYDLDDIHVKICSGAYKTVNIIDMLFYLSNIEEIKNLNYLDTFIYQPKKPWE